MKQTVLETFVVAILVAVVLIMVIVTPEIITSEAEQFKEEGNTQCEHEFVITSKYSWFHQSYKTYSKCIKCGKEI